MAVSNTQLLTQKEPDRYKYYNEREKAAAKEFEGWDRRDFDDYVDLKRDNELKYQQTGTWDTDMGAQAKALREKYGMSSDNYGYNDLGEVRADNIYGDFLSYGLNHSDPNKRSVAQGLAEQYYDSRLPDDEYYGGGRGSGGSSSGGGGSGMGGFQMPEMPSMRSGKSMAELLGVIYDYDKIHGMYKDAVEKKYANLDVEAARTQDMLYDTVGNNADTLMGILRRGDRDAVRSGTASGSQSATELSALLGISADAGQGATELAQARGDLVNKRETELANVTKDALKYYNDLGINLGQLSASELNALVTAYASQVATAGGVYNTDVLASVERDKIASQEKISAADNLTRENIAKWGNASNEEIASANNLTAKEVEDLRGEWNKAIAETNAASYKATGSGYASYGGQPVAAGSKESMSLQLRLEGLYASRYNASTDDTPEGRRLVQAIDREIANVLGMDYDEIIKSKVHQAFDRGDLPLNEGTYTKPRTGKPLTNEEIISEALKGMKDFSGKRK